MTRDKAKITSRRKKMELGTRQAEKKAQVIPHKKKNRKEKAEKGTSEKASDR